MLAGVGPLLGDTVIGRFESGPDAQRWLYRRGMSGLLHANGTVDTITQVTVAPIAELERNAPLALLFDGGTGSSGEAVAVAFLGRPGTRGFGEATAGFATSNRGSRLADGASMVVTTGYYTDRTGREHAERLEPDTLVTGGVASFPFPTDRVARTAAAWVRAQPGCRDGGPMGERCCAARVGRIGSRETLTVASPTPGQDGLTQAAIPRIFPPCRTAPYPRDRP